MNMLEAVEQMCDAKKLWLKQEPFTEDEVKRVKQYLFNYYQNIEQILKNTNLKSQ